MMGQREGYYFPREAHLVPLHFGGFLAPGADFLFSPVFLRNATFSFSLYVTFTCCSVFIFDSVHHFLKILETFYYVEMWHIIPKKS